MSVISGVDYFQKNFIKFSDELEIYKKYLCFFKKGIYNLPNLLVVSKPEYNPNLIIYSLLSNIYKNESIYFSNVDFTTKINNNSKIAINGKDFVYFTEFTPCKYGTNDRYVFRNIIKNIIKQENLKYGKHLFIINNIEKCTVNAQLAAKSLIEKGYNNLVFIFITNKSSSINSNLRNMLSTINISSYTNNDFANIIKRIKTDEYLNTNFKKIILKREKELNKLIKKNEAICNGNIIQFIINIFSTKNKLNYEPLENLNNKIMTFLKNLYNMKKKNILYYHVIDYIRKEIYIYKHHNYDISTILKICINFLISNNNKIKISDNNIIKYITYTAEYQKYSINASRDLFTYEFLFHKYYELIEV